MFKRKVVGKCFILRNDGVHPETDNKAKLGQDFRDNDICLAKGPCSRG